MVAPGYAGSILYGDFQVQHDIATFRSTFTVPDECQKANLLQCPPSTSERLKRQYHAHTAARKKEHAP